MFLFISRLFIFVCLFVCLFVLLSILPKFILSFICLHHSYLFSQYVFGLLIYLFVHLFLFTNHSRFCSSPAFLSLYVYLSIFYFTQETEKLLKDHHE